MAPVGAGLFALQKDWRFAQDEGFQFHAVVLFCKVRHGWGERNVIPRFFTTWCLCCGQLIHGIRAGGFWHDVPGLGAASDAALCGRTIGVCGRGMGFVGVFGRTIVRPYVRVFVLGEDC